MLVPEAVLDEKQGQLFLFINPLLENSQNSLQESIAEVEALLPKKLIQSNFNPIVQLPETHCESLSHGGKMVCIAEDWRAATLLLELFCIQPIILDLTRYFVIPLFKDKSFIHHKYVVEGLSVKQISREINCSRSAVLDALAEFHIEIRAPHFNHGHPSQPRYGKKHQKNSLVDHKFERRIIDVVGQLRENGLTLRQIAQVLSDMKIPTKCRGKAWHPEMVRRIIEGINPNDG